MEFYFLPRDLYINVAARAYNHRTFLCWFNVVGLVFLSFFAVIVGLLGLKVN